MALTRRTFLRQTGGFLAGFGLSETIIGGLPPRYQQALAEPSAQKLALLVGVNQYAAVTPRPHLNGCLQDIALQRELLIHRFGFRPQDIVELTDKTATLAQVETAMVEHVLETARTTDVVFIHFSGLGTQVVQQIGTQPHSVPALLLADTQASPQQEHVGYEQVLLLSQLAAWLKRLKTPNIITVVDAGFNGVSVATPGYLRLRSCPTGQLKTSGTAPRGLSITELPQSLPSTWPGLQLMAARASQGVAEVQWPNYAAGVFTDALTQHLWQVMPAQSLIYPLQQVASQVTQHTGITQVPESMRSKRWQGPVAIATSAEGVIVDLDDSEQTATAWLGGVPGNVLAAYRPGTCFQWVPTTPTEPAPAPCYWQLTQTGLEGQLQRLGNTPDGPGSEVLTRGVLQEVVRVVKQTHHLNIALGQELDRIERVDATSAFSDQPHWATVSDPDQPADCLFTKLKRSPIDAEASDQAPDAEAATPSSLYGLCLLGGEVLPKTLHKSDAAIKTAIHGLDGYLSVLLMAKLLDLTVNHQSSRLGAQVTLWSKAPGETARSQVLMAQNTPRTLPAPGPPPAGNRSSEPFITAAAGTQLRVQLHNQGDQPLYWLMVGMDAGTQAFTCYPLNDASPQTQAEDGADASNAPPEPSSARLAPKAKLTLPTQDHFTLRGPEGWMTAYLILSRQPLAGTMARLQEDLDQAGKGPISERLTLPDPLAIAQTVVQDLHDISQDTTTALGIDSESNWVLAVEQWVTFKFRLRVT